MTARPLVSIICPTIGRSTLQRTLASIRGQADAAAVEIIVCADTYQDTFAAALAPVPALCAAYGAQYVGFDAGRHAFGHPQRQAGATFALGDWLMWSQDDNVYRDGAIGAILDTLAAGPRCPRLFRVMTRWGFIVWDQVGNLSVGHVDADCIAVPREPTRLGHWGNPYEADAAFIAETVGRWQGRVEWEPALIVDSRP